MQTHQIRTGNIHICINLCTCCSQYWSIRCHYTPNELFKLLYVSTGSLSISCLRTWVKFSINIYREACKTAGFFRMVFQRNFLDTSFYTLSWRSHSGCQSMLDRPRRGMEVATLYGSRFDFAFLHSGNLNYVLLCGDCKNNLG